MIRIGQGAEVAIDIRDQRLVQVSPEIAVGQQSGQWNVRSLRGVAKGHDHDHWLRTPSSDQVVEDIVGMAHLGPAVCRVARAVDEVEHRIVVTAIHVAWRGVDIGPPAAINRIAPVIDAGDGAVRHLGMP